jgi:1-deoxy-D-xylulose-5-phosphate synthase
MVSVAVEAAEKLETEGIEVTVWDVRVVSPPDPTMLADAARHRQVITAEDGLRQGGAGMFVADAMRSAVVDGTDAGGDLLAMDVPPVTVLGIDRVYIPQDKPDRILARFGLDTPGLVRTVHQVMDAPVLPGPADD